MSFKKFIRRNIYQWHRVTSLLIAVPVLLWTVSGFLHPVMGSFKPDVKNSRLPAIEIDTAKISISLQAALLLNRIDSFQNFRTVKLYKGFYYQVWQKGIDSLTYLNCESGIVLSNGDKHYANYLAQRHMWEETRKQQTDEHDHGKMTASISGGATIPAKKLATVKPTGKITSTKLLTSFSKHYKASNKILPVYEVAFDRHDSIRLYIETKADRLAFASDQKKRWFTSFFSVTHSWSFLNGMGKTKCVLIGTFSALCFISSVAGFAVHNVLKSKKKGPTKNKRWHRILGNIFLLTTLLYAFSGAWHAFAKLAAKPNPTTFDKANIGSDEVDPDIQTIHSLLSPGEKLMNVSVAKMHGETFWQLSVKQKSEVSKKYINTKTKAVVKDGDDQYGAYLAARFKGTDETQIASSKRITAFNHSYSMMNKRLPVIENKFAGGDAVYIETATGEVAAVTTPADEAERFCFSNLHMHHYWEMWQRNKAGKAARNTVLITSTLGLLLLALTGTLIYFRKRFKTNSQTKANS